MEAWTVLRAELQRYRRGEIKPSYLRVVSVQRRRGPQTFTLRGKLRFFDAKLEMIVLKSPNSSEEFLGRMQLRENQGEISDKLVTCLSEAPSSVMFRMIQCPGITSSDSLSLNRQVSELEEKLKEKKTKILTNFLSRTH